MISQRTVPYFYCIARPLRMHWASRDSPNARSGWEDRSWRVLTTGLWHPSFQIMNIQQGIWMGREPWDNCRPDSALIKISALTHCSENFVFLSYSFLFPLPCWSHSFPWIQVSWNPKFVFLPWVSPLTDKLLTSALLTPLGCFTSNLTSPKELAVFLFLKLFSHPTPIWLSLPAGCLCWKTNYPEFLPFFHIPQLNPLVFSFSWLCLSEYGPTCFWKLETLKNGWF